MHLYFVLDEIASGFSDKSTVFSAFNKSIGLMISKLKEVIYAASSSNKALGILIHIFNERMDALFDALEGNDLQLFATTFTLRICLDQTMQRVRTAPSFESLGRFSSVLSHLCNGSRWTEVNDTAKLLLAMDDFSEALSVRFPGEQDNFLYNMEVMGHRESLQIVMSILPKLVDAKLNTLGSNTNKYPDTRIRMEAIMKRVLVVSTRDLMSVTGTGEG